MRVVDVAGTISTGYCAKLYADYGAEVINLEPPAGFATRQLPPFTDGETRASSAMHAYLHTNKLSVDVSALAEAAVQALVTSADLILDDGTDYPGPEVSTGVRASICWFGRGGAFENFVGTDGQIFALNGMLRNIGRVEGPPLIPTGYQAQIIGGMTAFIGSMTQVLAAELENRSAPVHLETSIYESCLCFTEVGVVAAFNTGLHAPRMGINRFPPTYPLGVFPCRDGWIGVTVLTPGQWHAYCELLGMEELTDVELFQTSYGRLQAIDLIEPIMRERLATRSAEQLFYQAQKARIPLARVPTMEELFSVDQFVERKAFCSATLPNREELTVPSVPFRLYDTPPNFGGPVARLGQHSKDFT
ncbi:MAG: CaiB/BaiF CoA-transferase family protein [Gammaproteobacteria bacterium]|nr:CaiB/BaiF CoA-transferase family protein [Gammaproteobacteria bacterium]